MHRARLVNSRRVMVAALAGLLLAGLSACATTAPTPTPRRPQPRTTDPLRALAMRYDHDMGLPRAQRPLATEPARLQVDRRHSSAGDGSGEGWWYDWRDRGPVVYSGVRASTSERSVTVTRDWQHTHHGHVHDHYSEGTYRIRRITGAR